MDTLRISDLSIAAMIFDVLFALALPLVPFLILHKKMKARFVPLLIGAATFVISALIVEAAVHKLILGNAEIYAYMMRNPLLYGLYGGLMAGLFEESGRFGSFKIMGRKYNTSGDALSYGLGHGGGEAVIIFGFTVLNSVVLAIMVNLGAISSLNGLIPAEQLQATVNNLAGTPSAMFLVGALERTGAVAFHVGASILVYLAASRRASFWFYPLAILLHMLLDLPAALVQAGVFSSMFLMETFLLVFSGLLLWFAISRLRAADKKLAVADETPDEQ